MATLPPLLALAAGHKVRPRKPANSEPPRGDRNAEAKVQAAIIEWIRLVAPGLLAFHVPNGGFRTPAEAARLKWVGVLPGVPDIVIIGPGARTWLIEVKGPGGVLSKDQLAVRDWCRRNDVPWRSARSIDDAREAFGDWEIPTREVR